MAEYRAVYRCRLCGEEFITCSCSEKIAFSTVVSLETSENFSPNLSGASIYRFNNHNCKDGSYGFADFIGFRKVD